MRRFATLLVSTLLLSASAKVQPSVEIVLARCRENIEWVDDLGYGGITTVYDKCKVTTGPGRHVERANLGRESGTYLQHIVENYENLADWTVFTQAEKPTYGYRGHRLGGGHMMRNVLFQDYVDAAETREENPLFFVFTSVMLANKGHVYQCIRQGYGEEYTKPTEEAFTTKMCGAVDDWQQWYEFPQWFTDMLQRLQQEQSAPVTNFDVAKAFEIFSIQPTEGVTFFAQGARFAASREAIQARPKSYYEGVLGHLQQQDPWAGYYLEWMWFYVLGGNNAPCGFEEPVLHGHLSWESTAKGRDRFELQQTSGSNALGGNTSGTVQYPTGQNFTSKQVVEGDDVDVLFPSGPLVFLGDFQFTSAAGSLIGEELIFGALVKITTLLVQVTSMQCSGETDITATLTITATLLLNTGATLITRGDGVLRGAGSGGGKISHKGKGKKLAFIAFIISGGLLAIELTITGATRRTDLTTLVQSSACGLYNSGTFTLGSGTVMIADLSCSVTQSGFTSYSSVLGSTTASGGLLYLIGISNSAKPVYMQSLTNPTQLLLEFDNITSTFTSCINAVAYAATSCTTSFSTTVDVSGYVQYSGPSNGICYVQFCPSTSSSQDNGALYALFALLAIIPIAGLIGWAVWYYTRGEEAAPVDYNQYYYPEPYPRAAYPAYPAYAPYGAEAYPFQGGFAAPLPTPAYVAL